MERLKKVKLAATKIGFVPLTLLHESIIKR